MQFNPRRIQLHDRLADQFAQAGGRRPGLVGGAGGMVPVPGIRHALDLVLATEGDVHLDTARHAQAPRTGWCVVGQPERSLQLRILSVVDLPADREPLSVHRSAGRSSRWRIHASSSSTLASSARGRGSCSRTALRSAMPSTSPT